MNLSFYDRKGVLITFDKWSKLMNCFFYKVLKQDDLKNYFISTVWLGLEHGFKDNKPIIFETVVFKNEKQTGIDYLNLYQERYTTEEEAIKGHEEAINKVLDDGFFIQSQKEGNVTDSLSQELHQSQ